MGESKIPQKNREFIGLAVAPNLSAPTAYLSIPQWPQATEPQGTRSLKFLFLPVRLPNGAPCSMLCSTTMILSWKKFTKSTSSQRRRSSLNGTKPIFPSFFQRFLLILQALNTTLDYIIVRAGSAGYSLPFRICENPNAPSNARAVQSASKNQFCYHIWAVCIMARRIGARIPRSLQHLGVDIPISRRVSVL